MSKKEVIIIILAALIVFLTLKILGLSDNFIRAFDIGL